MMRLRGLRTLVQMDAVLYVHGGPKEQSPKDLDDCIHNAILSGAVPRPIAFLRESVVSNGLWPERWRTTMAFKNKADAEAAAPTLRKLSVVVNGQDLWLQVTSLAYCSTHYGKLGWITTDIGAKNTHSIVLISDQLGVFEPHYLLIK